MCVAVEALVLVFHTYQCGTCFDNYSKWHYNCHHNYTSLLSAFCNIAMDTTGVCPYLNATMCSLVSRRCRAGCGLVEVLGEIISVKVCRNSKY